MNDPRIPSRPALLFTVAALPLALWACASVSETGPAQAPVLRPDEDVPALKERVTRLERRLADVDAKLGLLLAQRASSRPSPMTRRAIDLGPAPDLQVGMGEAEDEASLGGLSGTRAVDLGARAAEEVPPELEPTVVDDGEPPVVIRLRGAPEPRTPRSAELAGQPGGGPVQERYSSAHARLKEGRIIEAISIFEGILSENSAHDLADNSMYWIGWAQAERGEHRLAIDCWRRLPLRFPKSPKVPDALYGMAVSHEALGEPALAETLYEQITTQFPRAEKVTGAKQALGRLRSR